MQKCEGPFLLIKVTKKKPYYATAWFYLGDAYANLDRLRDAIRTFKRALRIKPDYSEARYYLKVCYLNRADTFFNAGQYRHAIEDYTQAIQLDPSDKFSYVMRANAYSELGSHLTQAIEDYSQAIYLDEHDAEIYWFRGFAYVTKGKWQQAIEDYSQAISLDPNNPEYWNSRAFVYSILGIRHSRYRRFACNDYEKACKLGDCSELIDYKKAFDFCR